jgi:hypothetical protein
MTSTLVRMPLTLDTKMTINDFKHSDFYHILKVAKELSLSISQFVIRSCLNIFKGIVWASKKTYSYVMS